MTAIAMFCFLSARFFVFKNWRLQYLICFIIGGVILEVSLLVQGDILASIFNGMMTSMDAFTLLKHKTAHGEYKNDSG